MRYGKGWASCGLLLAMGAVATAQVADFQATDRFAWGVGGQLPAPYTQLNMQVTIRAQAGFFPLVVNQEGGIAETLYPKVPGQLGFSVPLSQLSPLLPAGQNLNLTGVASGPNVTWTINQLITVPGGIPIVTTVDFNGTPLPVNLVVNNLNITGGLRSAFASTSSAFIPVLNNQSTVRGTHVGGDVENRIDLVCGTVTGTIGGFGITALRLEFRRIQHILHVPVARTATVNVALQNWLAGNAGTNVQWQLLPASGDTPLQAGVGTLNSSGAFSINFSSQPAGSYRLRLDGGAFLSKTVPLTLGESVQVNATLGNGDANNDGIVDGNDVNAVLGQFGSETPTQGPTWPDVNGDGIVDGNDVNVILGNFGSENE